MNYVSYGHVHVVYLLALRRLAALSDFV